MSKALVAYFSASGVTAKVAAKLASGAKVAEGKRFSARVEEAELAKWAAEWR